MAERYIVRLCGNDDKVHAFDVGCEKKTLWWAKCGHSVPVAGVLHAIRPTPSCMPCLVGFGAAEADGLRPGRDLSIMSSLEESVVRRPIGVAARELGEELRQERMRAGLKATFVSESLGWSTAKLSKLEAGGRGTDEWDVGTLLGTYGTDKNVRVRLRKLVQGQGDEWLIRDYVGRKPQDLLCWRVHEDLALTISCYEPLAIPSLLRTERYAHGLSGDDVGRSDSLASQQFASCQVPDGSVLPEIAVFIHEVALRLVVVSEAVMHDQLMHLNFQCDRENLQLRIVPSSAGGSAAMWHPGVLMTFPEPSKPLACLETGTAMVFTEQDQAVGVLQEKFDLLDKVALGTDASREALRYWADVYDSEGG